MNPELRELVTIGQANALMAAGAWLAAAVALLGAAAGALWPAARLRLWAVAAAAAPWSIFLSAGWDLYLWRVRFDPATGSCGLHSVTVLATNALAAVVVGVVYGLYLRWVFETIGRSAGS